MKIERIAHNKLKVTLELTDMLKWNIDYHDLPENIPGPGDMFWDILRIAEKETGMVFENCKLTVEAMQKSESSFVMYITKGELCGTDKSTVQKKYRYKKKQPRHGDHQSILIYGFRDLDDVCRYARMYPVYGELLDCMNSLYRYKEMVYLCIDLPAAYNKYITNMDVSFKEYANRVDHPEIFWGILKEYGNLLIAGNAMKILSEL